MEARGRTLDPDRRFAIHRVDALEVVSASFA
jgi:hypothetical protein